MTTRATNAWINYEDLIALTDVALQDVGLMSLGHQTIRMWLENANREFARLSGSVRDVHKTVMIADQQEYRLPDDVLRPDLVSMLWPGRTTDTVLHPISQQKAVEYGYLDGTGEPANWYLTHDRRSVGLVFIPSDGGVNGLTTGLAGDTTSIVDSALSSTDDAYNGLKVRILSGDEEGAERTISDYDGGTTTITVDSAFDAAIASGVLYAIHPDSLTVRYTKAGNRYDIRPTTGITVQATPTPTRSTFGTNLPDRPIDYYKGCEIRFTDNTLKDEVTRIVACTSDTAPITTVTVEPELFKVPVSADAVTVTDVPNIPGSFHQALVHGAVFMALERAGDRRSRNHEALFLNAIEQSKMSDRPLQGQSFHRVRETRWGDEGWD
jgi:hypothetical protein